ncbi:MAG: twin-arginine translocase subunit TatC [Halorhodospira halophila]|uniref:twin-arginine translocase subunit TatC n=1 Tax=Halorhodospira TaxID=85108 RepID=UPI0019118E33|nr:twin-arginine translocase subunit TatC [Halorhodospira halophila]MCG5532384.1 twin-arginine translocase subunit TatC [Halorhodospira sp. 9621]MCG5537988.1 twin-arginine translocase subunit TatC [Halorhodospira sp. 9622]MCG5542668.1 twin-arginine translocase subunit TatC [Halorhodospira sp. 9628]MBK5935771.1 twin-arginine translocase subunit TatC [Halorhodospira halophila]MBK5943465.1 twin-arginine translocase subunit TatC [Halorhodospira halophila]
MSAGEPDEKEGGDEKLQEAPLLSHLKEFRDRLLRIVVVVLGAFLLLYPFRDTLYRWISGPLQEVLPEGTSMIAIKVASPFLIPMKLALVAAIFITIPYILYQLWAFVAPGLYRHERRMIWPLLISSTGLFYLGAAFAYFVVFPIAFRFFALVSPEGVQMMTDIGEYLSFVLTLFFAFGAAFQVPIATILLVRSGISTRESLAAKRPYVIVGAFVVGMMLTPPDVLSQVLLAVPVWLLYEIGILLAGRTQPAEAASPDGGGGDHG